jgi:energy-coupling factor transport system substrate-specific component
MCRVFPGRWLTPGRPVWTIPLAVLAGAALNTLFNLTNQSVASPLFLDSIWTAVCAGFFGPLPGMACGLASNALAGAAIPGAASSVWFAPCNMATGLIMGIAVRRGWMRHLNGCLAVILALALVNSLLGAFIAVWVFGGLTGHHSDYLVSGLTIFLQELYSAAFLARIPVNLIDKSITVLATALLIHLAGKTHAQEPKA